MVTPVSANRSLKFVTFPHEEFWVLFGQLIRKHRDFSSLTIAVQDSPSGPEKLKTNKSTRLTIQRSSCLIKSLTSKPCKIAELLLLNVNESVPQNIYIFFNKCCECEFTDWIEWCAKKQHQCGQIHKKMTEQNLNKSSKKTNELPVWISVAILPK